MKIKSVVLCSFPVLIFMIFASCTNSPLEMAQDFIANRPPEINRFYTTTDISKGLVPNMTMHLVIEAKDPDAQSLEYSFDTESGIGSFAYKKKTDEGCTIDYYLPDAIPTGLEFTVTVSISDPKKGKAVQTLNLGSGKTGPVVSIQIKNESGFYVEKEGNKYVKTDYTALLELTSDSDGFYQVIIYDDFDAEPEFDETKPVHLYRVAGGAKEISLAASGTSADAVISPNTPQKVCVFMQDTLGQTTKHEYYYYSDTAPPAPLMDYKHGIAITKNQTLEIPFDEELQISGGDAFNPSDSANTILDNGNTASASVSGSTLTITLEAGSSWSMTSAKHPDEYQTGFDRIARIKVKDSFSNEGSIDIRFHVFDKVLYVNSNNNAASPDGSSDNPYGYIQDAVNSVNGSGDIVGICVSQGTHTSQYSVNGVVLISNYTRVNFLGGYAYQENDVTKVNRLRRNPQKYPSVISFTAPDPDSHPGTLSSPRSAILFCSDFDYNYPVLIDGFIFEKSGHSKGSHVVSDIFCNNHAAIIQGNVFRTAQNTDYSLNIAVLYDNKIDGNFTSRRLEFEERIYNNYFIIGGYNNHARGINIECWSDDEELISDIDYRADIRHNSFYLQSGTTGKIMGTYISTFHCTNENENSVNFENTTADYHMDVIFENNIFSVTNHNINNKPVALFNHHISEYENSGFYCSYNANYNNFYYLSTESSESEMYYYAYGFRNSFLNLYNGTFLDKLPFSSLASFGDNSISLDASLLYSDGLWLLQQGSPVPVKAEGVDDSPATNVANYKILGKVVPTDFFGNPRTGNGTDGVSMGAHEIDE